ncbi:MAG: ABC transporter ATP-binding protein [Lachnospiraceae bacterium]|nr:ABC transporter ATP-binding protein [Lachnospiraceae bacterium]MBP5263402.1 ABC transporter ATP-binding protein [Lachnospiraceae bacterium]
MKLEIKELRKQYGKKLVLDGIDLTVNSGSCIGILGGNGSGKSTLLSILAGIVKANGGSFKAEVDGKARIGYVPQGTPLLEELSAKDNLRLWYDKSTMQKELSDGVLKLLGVDEFLKVPVRKMSGGMKKRLSIGCAVAGDPQILLLDEPTAAIDIACKDRIYAYVKEFASKGGIVLWATHDAHEMELCDECYVLKNGKLTKWDFDGDIHRLAQWIT